MGVRILFDRDTCRAALYDSVTERALPCPLFIADSADDEAQCFLDWLGCDARVLPADLLGLAHMHWHRTHHTGNGDWLDGESIPDDESRRVLRLVAEASRRHEVRRALRRADFADRLA